MSNIIGRPITTNTHSQPITAHLLHLRHLSKANIAKSILQERHGYQSQDAREASKLVASYVEQAIRFFETCQTVPRDVKPLLQYYSYLNFAVAVILTCRPIGWERYRHHGVMDQTATLERLSLKSPVIAAAKKGGAVPLFHSVLASKPIDGRRFRAIDLLTNIPLCSAELEEMFGVTCFPLVVTTSVGEVGGRLKSTVNFSLGPRIRRVPRRHFVAHRLKMKCQFLRRRIVVLTNMIEVLRTIRFPISRPPTEKQQIKTIACCADR